MYLSFSGITIHPIVIEISHPTEGLAKACLQWRFSIKTISLKNNQSRKFRNNRSWASSTYKSHEICSQLFWYIPELTNSFGVWFVCCNLFTGQHLHKKATKFSLKQTSKWIEKSYVFCLCKEWSWLLLKSNVHFKQYFECLVQKESAAINQVFGGVFRFCLLVFFFFFHIHIFVHFLKEKFCTPIQFMHCCW